MIQKALLTFKAPLNEFIFKTMIGKCKEIATHKHGCCVMQKCIDGATGDQRERLVSEITKHTKQFVQDAYGNYVVRYLMLGPIRT